MIELLLVGGLLAGLAAYYWHGRTRLSQRVQDLLTAHVQTDAQGHVVFDGKQAQTLSEDLGYGGNDTTGPWVQAQLVCQMPSGQVFDVMVHTGHRQAPATVQVAQRGAQVAP